MDGNFVAVSLSNHLFLTSGRTSHGDAEQFWSKTSRKVDWRLAQCEGALLKLYSHRDHHDLMRHRLSAITGAMDNSLLERLIDLGFDSETLEAIRYAPIAEVAWPAER